MRNLFLLFFGLFIALNFSVLIKAQELPISFYGDVKFAHVGIDTEADGLGGPNTVMRLRPGVKYFLNDNHSFSGRLVYLVSKEIEPLTFTLQSDGNNQLAFGSMSLDEFYYQFQKDDLLIKAGRFQKSVDVLSNAQRSHFRFQSNAANMHWSDGFYLKKDVSDNWYSELIVEYQNKDAISYPYKGLLNFGNNQHNLNYYVGAESRTQHANIIQKGFGIFVAPKSYLKPNGFSTYAAVMSRIALDFPMKDALKGGSIRVAGEIGQNLNTAFKDGTNAVASIGINNFAEHHEFMIELGSTDSQWLTASAYGANSDEIEFRYRYILGPKFNFDIRYRIRESRVDFIPTQYSTFVRFTFSL